MADCAERFCSARDREVLADEPEVLDFFDYLPNGVNYIRQRVVEALEIRF